MRFFESVPPFKGGCQLRWIFQNASRGCGNKKVITEIETGGSLDLEGARKPPVHNLFAQKQPERESAMELQHKNMCKLGRRKEKHKNWN